MLEALYDQKSKPSDLNRISIEEPEQRGNEEKEVLEDTGYISTSTLISPCLCD